MQDPKIKILKLASELSHEQDEQGKSLWFYAWQRLKQNKLAFSSTIVLMLMIILIIIGPYFSPYEIDFIDWEICQYHQILPQLIILAPMHLVETCLYVHYKGGAYLYWWALLQPWLA